MAKTNTFLEASQQRVISFMAFPILPLICSQKLNLHAAFNYFFFLQLSVRKHCKNLKITSLESYLPPPKGLFREYAVLSGHQRVDGLIEALSKPWVSFEICNTLPTSTWPFGEKAVWKLKCLFENIERGVPESVTKQERCKGNATKKESKGPDFSTFD